MISPTKTSACTLLVRAITTTSAASAFSEYELYNGISNVLLASRYIISRSLSHNPLVKNSFLQFSSRIWKLSSVVRLLPNALMITRYMAIQSNTKRTMFTIKKVKCSSREDTTRRKWRRFGSADALNAILCVEI